MCCQFNQLSRTNSISAIHRLYVSFSLRRLTVSLPLPARTSPSIIQPATSHTIWRCAASLQLTISATYCCSKYPVVTFVATRSLLQNLCCSTSASHSFRRLLNDTPNYPLCRRKCSDDCHLSCGCVGSLVCYAVDMSHPSSTS